MSYTKSEMLYTDYKWTAQADKDNPYYTKGTDYSELNRSEGYEMLYFINHLGAKRWTNAGLPEYRKMERLIRTLVPSNIRTHKKIEDWIVTNWTTTP